MSRGHTSLIAYGRPSSSSKSRTYQIGGPIDVLFHGVRSLLLDGHGLGSKGATRRLVRWLDNEGPDVVSLHNIHGYFLHFPVLFEYLKQARIPIVWTLHDCWPFTGHCSYFDRVKCEKWQTQCFECPMTRYYPKSLIDKSQRNFDLKKAAFSGLSELTLVTPSAWLKRLVQSSFLGGYPVRVIHNGVDLATFAPALEGKEEDLILGVANVWSDRKGLADFLKLRQRLPSTFRIVLIGLNHSQRQALPEGIEGFGRTESLAELVSWYQRATVYINPTYSDNFPTTNIEALACGVPVVTYDTGGSPEAIDDLTGRIVSRGDIEGLAAAIVELTQSEGGSRAVQCRKRAEQKFNQVERFADYVDLYESLVYQPTR